MFSICNRDLKTGASTFYALLVSEAFTVSKVLHSEAVLRHITGKRVTEI